MILQFCESSPTAQMVGSKFCKSSPDGRSIDYLLFKDRRVYSSREKQLSGKEQRIRIMEEMTMVMKIGRLMTHCIPLSFCFLRTKLETFTPVGLEQ